LKDIERIGNSNNPSAEWRHLKKNGELIIVEISAHSILYKGKKARHVLVNDITQRKLAETEIKLKNKELILAHAEKDKFFSIIAHDLRSPFNGFLGLTQLMAEELPSLTMTQIQELAFSMKDSATNLYSLLENLLKWSKFQKGSIPFAPEVIQLKPVIDECIAVAFATARNKGIEISCTIPEGVEAFADSNMFKTVIRNLVSNALKFTHKGGEVSVSAKVAGDKSVEISVRDSGIGMNQTMIDNLFRPDVRTSRKGTDDESSTGLGLLLCKEFIEKNGGHIRAESEEGKGSVFYFSVPFITPSPDI
jgi:signal transduction histidine kinase